MVARPEESSCDFKYDSGSSHIRNKKHHRSKNKGPKVLSPVNNRSCKALNFQIYCPVDVSSKYDECVAKSVPKFAKWLQMQMKTTHFWLIRSDLDSRFSIDIPARIWHEWHSRGHWHVAVTLLHGDGLAAALKSRVAQSSKSYKRQMEEKDWLWSGQLPPGIYATDDVIAKVEDEALYFTQPSNMTPKEYAEALWIKELRCHHDYDEYVVKGILIKGLHGSLRHSMRSYWSPR